jgi:hypothetical protein
VHTPHACTNPQDYEASFALLLDEKHHLGEDLDKGEGVGCGMHERTHKHTHTHTHTRTHTRARAHTHTHMDARPQPAWHACREMNDSVPELKTLACTWPIPRLSLPAERQNVSRLQSEVSAAKSEAEAYAAELAKVKQEKVGKGSALHHNASCRFV